MSSKKEYPVGYSKTVVQTFQRRSAHEKAAFILPHLKEDDHLLDCGWGSGSITLDFAQILKVGRVQGVDIEPSQIEHSKQLKKIEGLRMQTLSKGASLTSLSPIRPSA
ncbi:MAG: hypothetical protein KDK60_00750 [Chlamydiia bacterium]|nr:hypothetical protein [Chlamydiia bacterium]